MTKDDLFLEGDPFNEPAWRETEKTKPKRLRKLNGRHIGCSIEWLRRVLPLVHSKEQLAIAMWLHRRRAICKSDEFTVPNRALLEELGLSRFAKYRGLRHLEAAGIITLVRAGKQAAIVRLNPEFL